MWLTLPSDSLTRPRFAVAAVSAIAAASLSYYVYRSYSNDLSSGTGLHRSNAVRRSTRRLRRASIASEPSQPDENANADNTQLNDGDTVVDDWWNDPNVLVPPARAGHNIVSLLFRVSEDNARRNACVHRGCACNACGVVPIRGVRYRCANCADFDLCETCEAQGVHFKTHIFYKIKIPAPPFGPRQMQPVWYAGDPDTCIRNLPRMLIQKLSTETGFERPEIEAFWEQFTFMANSEWRDDPDGLQLAMDKKTFERCLVPSGGSRHATPNLIHDRMFAFYDTNNDDLIGFSEFLHGLAYRKRKDKLRRIFEGYDIDADGFVNRRDFLRMFRAYYVLYKQMHRDILDGLDDQLMGSTEAQQLVTSRQPLSSLFGREGRVPRSDGNALGEGKIFHTNGDVELVNGHSDVVIDDRGDTATREDILTRLFSPGTAASFRPSFRPRADTNGTSTSAGSDWNDRDTDMYWRDADLHPPETVDQLPALLDGSRREAHQEELDLDAELTSPEEEFAPGNHSDAENHSRASPIEADAHDDSAPTIDPGQFTGDLPTESQLRAQVTAKARGDQPEIDRSRRLAARQHLHERWKRRQFYLDVEEGGIEPEDWEDHEDVFEKVNGVGESSKTSQMLSSLSRSSSKVRFAEEADDDDIDFNTSTSKSASAHWDEFEIPDEERDAGKEILYQVTQQAFNELLNSIFRHAEDLAVRAAETKSQREKNRELFEHLDIDNRPTGETPAENKPIAERSLEELLQSSGYTVDTSLSPPTGDEEVAQPEKEDTSADTGVEEDSDFFEAVQEWPVEESRDPTMPQFRPNSAADIQTPAPQSPKHIPRPLDLEKGKMKKKKKKPTKVIPLTTLMEWKRLDLAEKQAEERGGWGRLNFEEFEDIYKSHESSGNRLDYLGSWVDFCIP
ncbi:hypothetical protein F5X68DRAFT_265773 [Plectosphaerella plurivora]|uniref:Uncharacterized protein n=1 Tax=Plectosphaerella plurivora TaxID=936078 RepID=A0A9P8V1J5_9PEZI|nr:hypothetical protein F5X68DRAFT_265773 [Plectosphaerella plurivora]